MRNSEIIATSSQHLISVFTISAFSTLSPHFVAVRAISGPKIRLRVLCVLLRNSRGLDWLKFISEFFCRAA